MGVDAISTWDVGMIAFDRDRREVVVQLLDRDAPLPQTVERVPTFPYAHMSALRVELTAGAASTRDEVVVIGVLELVGLPVRVPGDRVVLSVTRTTTEIHASLTDSSSGRTVSLRVPAA